MTVLSLSRPEFRMFDSVSVKEIPPDAVAVAGYVGGRWPTFPTLATTHQKAKRLSIAVNAKQDADCLDVETGNATNDQAPAWIGRQLARGVRRPVVYCSLANARTLTDTLGKAGIRRSAIRLWTAHYTYKPHRCSPACGFGMDTWADATQFTDKALGLNLDESLCVHDFL